jgi:microcompartment protein CcmL/EutN
MRLIRPEHAPVADAIALIELDGLARGVRLVDDLLKAASVRVLASVVYSGPRCAILFDGEVEALERAYAAGLSVAQGVAVDSVFLPFAHRELVAGLAAIRGSAEADSAILLVETETLSATIRSIDAGLKAVPVALTDFRFGRGIAGRGVFALRGALADLEAAQESVALAAGGGLRETQLIARPDPAGFWAAPFSGEGRL